MNSIFTKSAQTLLAAGLAVCVLVVVVYAGNLTPPGSQSAQSYTLGDIYKRLTSNTVTTAGNHSLSTTTSPASSFYTLTQIYNAIPTINPADFLSTSTYLGVTGSIQVKAGNTVAASSSAQGTSLVLTVPQGYYSGSSSVTVSTSSANFVASKIASSTKLFGITGTLYGDTDPSKVLTTATYPGTATAGYAYPSQPLKTGFTTCYDNQDYGLVINCSGTGQDGELQAGRVRPSDSFVDNGDGTAFDKLTGLSWTTCPVDSNGVNCSSPPYASESGALSLCNNLVLGGHSDWRLPNLFEMLTLPLFGALASYSGFDRIFDVDVAFWTSTPGFDVNTGGTKAWQINLYTRQSEGDGSDFLYSLPKTQQVLVLCVRS